MERIRFGYYYLPDFLGEERTYSKVKIEVFHPAKDSKQIKFDLEGSLENLELVMTKLFEEYGLPQWVCKPKGLAARYFPKYFPLLKLAHLLMPEKWLPEKTTTKAYDLIKTIFENNGKELPAYFSIEQN